MNGLPPPCYNRPPRAAGVWVITGTLRAGRFGRHDGRGIPIKHVIRWRWSPFVDRCAVHDGAGIGPNGESYPEAHGWMPWCRLCRWFPGARA